MDEIKELKDRIARIERLLIELSLTLASVDTQMEQDVRDVLDKYELMDSVE